MANNTRQAVKEAQRKREIYLQNYLNDFAILFHNSVEVEDLPVDLPKRYLLTILYEKGGIAFCSRKGKAYSFEAAAINIAYRLCGSEVPLFKGVYRTLRRKFYLK